MTNFEDALDAFHYQSFRNELYRVLLKSWVELDSLHKMADELAAAVELPEAFRQHYSDICKELPDLVERLYGLSLDVSPHNAVKDDVQAAFESDIPDAPGERCIEQLQQAEQGLIDIVDLLGKELGEKVRPAVNVAEGVTVDVTVWLKQVPTRQCYSKLKQTVAERDLFIAFSEFRASGLERMSNWPAYLLDHRIFPKSLLPMIDRLQSEFRFEGEVEYVFEGMNSVDFFGFSDKAVIGGSDDSLL